MRVLRVKASGVLADEATAVKNIESQTQKAVHLMAEGRPLLLLTGTPLNKPGDAYAYMRLIAPGIYRNHRQFEKLHIDETDDYGKPTSWKNLDLLAQNMSVQTSRVIRREVRAELPAIVYTQVPYRLEPEHLKLYRRITEERLVEFDDGKEIDAISASALRSALQQIIVNWGVFANDESKVPAVMELIEEVLEEIGDKKLAVVVNFRLSNKYLLSALSKYQAVAVYGDVTPKGKQQTLNRFITEPECRVILLHPDSAGFGVDGLQHVCSDMPIVEAPATPNPFQQVVARLDRDGQDDVVHVRIAIAQGTVQVSMFADLLRKDALVNSVQGSYKDLRDSLYGD